MRGPYQNHLKSSKSLQTTYEAVRAGFIALALEKNRLASPLVDQARTLKSIASKVAAPADLLSMTEIQASLITAAGVSDKASRHLTDADKKVAVTDFIKTFLEPAGVHFAEELVYRFLLTRGDTLGGAMRNIGGFMAQKKLSRTIISHLTLSGQQALALRNGTEQWTKLRAGDPDIEGSLRGIFWDVGNNPRTLLYNVKVPLVGNNVDFCLLSSRSEDARSVGISKPGQYLALGELKGGIDPAGADEHWKTARTALDRIHRAFAKKKLRPHTFFVGAAIEARMAIEIWRMLKSGKLANAANLTNEDQMVSITKWLCEM